MMLALGLLGACTSTTPPEPLSTTAGEPVAVDAGGAQADAANALTTDPAASPTSEAEVKVAALATTANIHIAPVIGAPSGAVQPMNRQIASRSAERGLNLVPAGTSNATHNMKGYFSAITENGKTTVIFVWDVFDASGNRLHRIQGQETTPGSSPDGWSSVNSRMMETIGSRTVDEFADWLASRKKSG